MRLVESLTKKLGLHHKSDQWLLDEFLNEEEPNSDFMKKIEAMTTYEEFSALSHALYREIEKERNLTTSRERMALERKALSIFEDDLAGLKTLADTSKDFEISIQAVRKVIELSGAFCDIEWAYIRVGNFKQGGFSINKVYFLELEVMCFEKGLKFLEEGKFYHKG